MTKPSSAQDLFLETLRKERTPVSIYLLNGIRLHGEIAAFDSFTILLKENALHTIYKHAIASISPGIAERRPPPRIDKARR